MTLAADLCAALDVFVGARCYVDETVPPGVAFPYISLLLDVVDQIPALVGDRRAFAYTSTAQVDLWQTVPNENDELIRQVRAALDGLTLSAPYRHLRVVSLVRVPEPPPSNVVHHAITIAAVDVG